MNSNDVLAILNDIAETGSRNDKEDILQRHIEDPMMKTVVSTAYDPFVTFGLTPPKAEGQGKQSFDDTTVSIWSFLNALAQRKITGGEAFELTKENMTRLNAGSAELLWRIMSKDLRCGITAKTVNKVLPGTIPTFDVMLAHKYEEKRIKKWPVAVEPKLDGVRVICLVRDGKAQFFSRTGKPFPAVEHLGEQVVKMVVKAYDEAAGQAELMDDKKMRLWSALLSKSSVALDGEILSGDFNKTVGDVRRKSEAAMDAQYHIFDALNFTQFTSNETDIKVSYVLRRQFVEYLVGHSSFDSIKATPRYLVNSPDEIQAYYQTFRDRGLEGAIVKPLEDHYRKKRSYGWLKMKNEETMDLRVIGAFEGTGKYEGQLGGLIVDCDGVEVRVGGGLSDVQRVEFWKEYLLNCQELEDGAMSKDSVQSLLNRLIEVEFHEKTPDGSLRHPRFIRFRDDKDEKAAA